MRAALLTLLVAIALPLTVSASLSLILNSDESYAVQVSGKTWLSSDSTFFHANNKRYTVADGSLVRTKNTTVSGKDALGSYVSVVYTYTTKSLEEGDAPFEATTAFTVYSSDLIMFEQTWVSGATGTTSNDNSWDESASGFPTFKLAAPSDVSLACSGWDGTFIDDSTSGPKVGLFPGCVVGGITGGPMAFFAQGTRDSVVFTPASEFMTATIGTGSAMTAGLMGTVESVPAGYTFKYMLSYNSTGLNNAMTGAGDRLLTLGSKDRTGPSKDFTLQYLGYNTDHGAYYYYNPEPNGDFNTTLVHVYESAKQLKIPYKWILLDSWWYYKGDHDSGVKNWTARPEIFPPGGTQGLADFTAITKWPVIGHNRYWSSSTTYAQQNGGRFKFSDTQYSTVVPLEQEFWDFLLSSSKKWGLYTYEQDWLYNELKQVPLLTKNATMARTWLMQMGKAAADNELTIQYCMAYPRHALQSTEISAVTQIRASDDYVPSRVGPTQWRLGSSSILAHALALAPFKDNFWTTVKEKGTSTGDSSQDPAVWREAVVATLSTGPVTPADGVQFQNKDLIMRSCRNDGRLINPDRPAVTMDMVFQGTAFGDAAGPGGQIWNTYSTVNGARYEHIFAAEVRGGSAKIYPANLTLDRDSFPSGGMYVAYAVTNTTSLDPSTLKTQAFSESSPIEVTSTDLSFDLWHVSPVQSNGIAVLGDISKWVPVAATRTESITVDGSKVNVEVLGESGEKVTIYFAKSDGTSPTSASCTVGSDGSCTVTSP